MKLVIIGSGTGGLFCAVTVKKAMRDADITFIDRKSFELLHPCGLPYVLEGKVKSFDELKGELPEMGFEKLLSHEVISVNPQEKKVVAKSLDSGEEKAIEYEKLLIATGSRAFVPPVDGANLKGVFKVDSYEESLELNEYAKNAKKAVVIGAGAIGLETGYALKAKGMEVTVVEMLGQSFAKALDPDMAGILDSYLKENGIKLMYNSKLESINGDGKVQSVTVNGQPLDADLVVLAAGVRPNTGFLDGSGIEMEKGAINVNDHMQTNFPDIYAVGDCVHVCCRIDQRNWMMQLAVAAYKQGIVAGRNMVGKDTIYKGALSTFASKIGELEIAATGFTAECANCSLIIGKASGPTKPEWCQGGKIVTIKLICTEQGKIIGGQGIGEGAASRINVISTAVQAGFSVYDLAETELAYCPAIAETYDVLMQAADFAIRRIES